MSNSKIQQGLDWLTKEMEKDKKVSFRSINPKDEITHIARLNKSGPAGTRLDMHLITNSRDATKAAKDKGDMAQCQASADRAKTIYNKARGK